MVGLNSQTTLSLKRKGIGGFGTMEPPSKAFKACGTK